jgi:hypothetical protein
MNLTVDCHQVANCTAIVDIECNGNVSTTPGATMSPSTVPVEFDNTKSRGIIQATMATINPVNSNTAINLRTGTGINAAITCSTGPPYTATVTSTTGSAGTIPTNWSNTPPYSLSAYVQIIGITTGTGWNNTWPVTSIVPGASGTFTIVGGGICPTVGSGSGATATLEPSADIIVCSGTGCAYGAEGNTSNNPTQVSLIQVHMEHAGVGVFATGANTTVNIVAPTTTVSKNSMDTSVVIDATNPSSSVNISSLLVNSGLQNMVVDGITGATLLAPLAGGTLASYVSGTNILPQSLLGPAGLQPPVSVAPTTATAITVTANNSLTTFDNTGSTVTLLTYTLPTPVARMTYTFLQSTANKISISPGTGVTIYSGRSCVTTPVSGDTLSSTTQYSAVTLQAINTLSWRATSCSGTWTMP